MVERYKVKEGPASCTRGRVQRGKVHYDVVTTGVTAGPYDYLNGEDLCGPLQIEVLGPSTSKNRRKAGIPFTPNLWEVTRGVSLCRPSRFVHTRCRRELRVVWIPEGSATPRTPVPGTNGPHQIDVPLQNRGGDGDGTSKRRMGTSVSPRVLLDKPVYTGKRNDDKKTSRTSVRRDRD